MTGSNEEQPDIVRELANGLEEDENSSTKMRYIVNFIIGIVMLGVIGRFFVDYIGESKIKNKLLTIDTESKKISLISSSDNNLIIRTDKGEIKLLNPNTQKVQDISHGNTQTKYAALSPDGQYIAYISTNSDGIALNLASQDKADISIFDEKTFNKEAQLLFGGDNTQISICEWSDIYWSPEKTDKTPIIEQQIKQELPPSSKIKKSKKQTSPAPSQNPFSNTPENTKKQIAFFACSDAASILYTVTMTIKDNAADSKIKPLLQTKSESTNQRKAVWLANGKIAFIKDESLLLLDPNTDEKPIQLYGSDNEADNKK